MSRPPASPHVLSDGMANGINPEPGRKDPLLSVPALPDATMVGNAPDSPPPPLHEAVVANLEYYFRNLGSSRPGMIYSMVVSSVEKPMLEIVMRETRGNQLRAAMMLGINRNTLRKKLQSHGLL